MNFKLNSKVTKADLLVVPLFKGEDLSTFAKSILDKDLQDELAERVKSKDFEGEAGQGVTFYPKKNAFSKVVFLGRGDKEKQLFKSAEHLGGKIASMAKGKKSVAVLLPEEEVLTIAHGIVLGTYEFKRYKKKDGKAVNLEEVQFLVKNGKGIEKELASVKAFINSSNLTRDLINTPAGDLSTKDLVEEAKKLAKKHRLKITILDDKKLNKLGCGSILGVGKGATSPSYMVFLEYNYKSKSKVPNLAFVGKGLVFDSGGLNLKPTGHIETMKEDMAGAASVLGTLNMIAELKIPGRFLGVLCCAENAVSDRAMHPGDVLKAYNGLTIEVTNTDAEGRLVLADGLSYTEKNWKPKKIVDMATLTGAVTVALGYNITGVMGNDEEFIRDFMKVGLESGEAFWQLPLNQEFVDACKGDFTDLKNSTDGVRAGSSMGAAFLKHFVEKTPWIHLDIAGTAWENKTSPVTKYGATGVVLRTLTNLAMKHSG